MNFYVSYMCNNYDFKALINAHPYHVDALLQLSELCRLSEDLPMAAELIEQALYCLECAFHPSFSLASGNCRLDYRRQENRYEENVIVSISHLVYACLNMQYAIKIICD